MIFLGILVVLVLMIVGYKSDNDKLVKENKELHKQINERDDEIMLMHAEREKDFEIMKKQNEVIKYLRKEKKNG